MVNVENVKRAIAVMEKTSRKSFDIRDWFGECGTVACFAGHLALSPDIPEIVAPPVEVTLFNPLDEDVADFLGISEDESYNICGLNNSCCSEQSGVERIRYDEYYMKFSSEVTPQDVIEKLKKYLEEV